MNEQTGFRLHVADVDVELNEEGFLIDPQNWTPSVAVAISRSAGTAVLTEEHWRLVHALRVQYASSGRAPGVLAFLRAQGLTQGALRKLFPAGPIRGLYRTAGVPKPVGCPNKL